MGNEKVRSVHLRPSFKYSIATWAPRKLKVRLVRGSFHVSKTYGSAVWDNFVTYSIVYHAQNIIDLFCGPKMNQQGFIIVQGFRTWLTSWNHPFCSFPPFSM